jgi:3-keto-L-gulonate-6-phosphate decarboxylase
MGQHSRTQEGSGREAPRRNCRGGARVNGVKDALKSGADILVVGRAITASKDVHSAAESFLEELNKKEID